MSPQIPPHAVDRLIELYCQWRSECWEIRSAYEQLGTATAEDRAIAYAAYWAALDREESAARAYADQMTYVASLARHAEKWPDAVESHGRQGSAATARGR